MPAAQEQLIAPAGDRATALRPGRDLDEELTDLYLPCRAARSLGSEAEEGSAEPTGKKRGPDVLAHGDRALDGLEVRSASRMLTSAFPLAWTIAESEHVGNDLPP
ncbi:hypothetical protein [Streptomyces sp. NPDC088557]|uniref:hypothetical protein n=1 Tax=Streptomyces sp. NPDC088557 TaxID=3365867 RepID=UPI00380F62CE